MDKVFKCECGYQFKRKFPIRNLDALYKGLEQIKDNSGVTFYYPPKQKVYGGNMYLCDRHDRKARIMFELYGVEEDNYIVYFF